MLKPGEMRESRRFKDQTEGGQEGNGEQRSFTKTEKVSGKARYYHGPGESGKAANDWKLHKRQLTH